jgi:methylated-DNA-[protein]-cysteine S-methyltransferase
VISVPIATAYGEFTAHFSECGLAELDFPERRRELVSPTPLIEGGLQSWLALTSTAVTSILAGREIEERPPLDLRAGTNFQQRVWKALCAIPLGETKNYGDIAREVGSPRGTRAVGMACGANPIPLIVPCHRVVAAGGKLGGFSGGLDWKKRLLAIEQKELFR